MQSGDGVLMAMRAAPPKSGLSRLVSAGSTGGPFGPPPAHAAATPATASGCQARLNAHAIERCRARHGDDGGCVRAQYRPAVALHFHPRPGTVLLCDYELGRLKAFPDEMTKRRPVVVLSQKRRQGSGPVIVVPFSTTAPQHPDERHVRIVAGSYEFLRSDVDSWVKCEFMTAVSGRRLDRLRRNGAYILPQLDNSDFRLILRAVARAIGGAGLLLGD